MMTLTDALLAASLIPLYVDLILRWKERHRISFSLQRFSEEAKKPIESNWGIRILHPNGPLEKCMVFYDGAKLPWWDKENECYYERFIPRGGGGNVRIPKGAEKEEARIIVKDGKTTILKRKFREIPIVPR